MLQRVEESDGFVSYRSPRLSALGVPHLFSTRLGGSALGELDVTLAEDAGLARVRRALGLRDRTLRALRQVHGAGVRDARTDFEGTEREQPGSWPAGDALVSDDSKALLVVRTADCVPVLFASADGTRVAAAHAGWRGLVAGVLEATVERFERPATVVAALGPSLSPERFQVGPEVAERFRSAGLGDAVLPRAGRRPHVDLWQAARVALGRVGVTAIDAADLCTWDGAGEFHSYRRDVTHGARTRAGSLGAFVALP